MQRSQLRFIFIALPLLTIGFGIAPRLWGHSDENQASSGIEAVAPAGAESQDEIPNNETLNPNDEVVVITNGNLIGGAGARAIADGVVVIEGNRIVAVGPLAEIDTPANAQIIDAAGGTILPGIINAHVHNSQSPGTRRRFLESGVTTTCDLATSPADMPYFEEAFTAQDQPVARGFRTGPMLTAPEGYPSQHGFHWDYEVVGPDEAQAAVTDLHQMGANMVKIALEPWQPQEPWPVLGLAEVQAAVDKAHTYGLPVRAHVQQARMLDIALQAGVDVIEHVPLPFNEEIKLQQLRDDERLSLTNFPALETQLTQMAQQGVALVPTLSVGACATRDMLGLESEARRRMCDFQLEIVGRFHELGGMVALGNDYGNPGVQRGMPVREMDLLQAAGLSPMAVIEAGTRYAAQVCGQGDALGTLEPGKLADLIVVNGNPLEALEALSQIQLVIKDGEIAHTPDPSLVASQ